MKKFKIKKLISIIIGIFIIICLLPDLLFAFRVFVNRVTNGWFNNLSDVEYTKIVVPTLFSGVAISVSVIAANIAKLNSKTQIAQHLGEVMYAASNLLRNIYHNTSVVYHFSKSYVDIIELEISDEEMMKKVYMLYAVDKIEFAQVELFEEYVNKLKNILELSSVPTGVDLQNAVSNFCSSYLKEDTVKPKGDFKKLVDKLEAIQKKED